jgi:hypothetical protein
VSTTGRRIHTNVPTHSTFEPDLAISAMKPPQPCGPGQATHRRRRAPLACRAVAHRQAPRPPLPSLVASCTSPGCLTSKSLDLMHAEAAMDKPDDVVADAFHALWS